MIADIYRTCHNLIIRPNVTFMVLKLYIVSKKLMHLIFYDKHYQIIIIIIIRLNYFQTLEFYHFMYVSFKVSFKMFH